MTLPQNQEAMPPEEKRCFNCGRKAIGESGSSLPLCRNHFDLSIVAGWKPRLYITAPPEPVSESRIAELDYTIEEREDEITRHQLLLHAISEALKEKLPKWSGPDAIEVYDAICTDALLARLRAIVEGK